MMTDDQQRPAPGDKRFDDVRIGVFVCHCGGNISDVVDIKRVTAEIAKLPNVVLATTHIFMCSDPGQALIDEKIHELGLNRVIVAACSPTLHQLTFRRNLNRAGLNQFLFEHVNIREQVSWVIEDHEAATRKAIRLVRAAVGRIRHLVPLTKRRIPIHPSALVIGGGVAGLVATRDLARRGMRVTLVENTPFLGGRMGQLYTLFPSNEEAGELLNTLIQEVVHHPLITVMTNTQVIASNGIVGDFQTKLQVIPRGVDKRLTYVGNAIAACPEETISEFNFGLTKRKAIYLTYPGCYPPVPAIDWRTCTKCGKCLAAVGGKGIDLNSEPHDIDVHSGVIVLATGYDPYEPMYGEYGYGIYPEVVTLQQLIRILHPEGPTGGQFIINGKPVLSLAFIHCAGARQYEGMSITSASGKVNDYCARTCCTATLHSANYIKERYPDTRIYDFYQDIRTYGRGHERYYEQASLDGVLFLRFEPHHLPKVRHDPQGEYPLLVMARDRLTGDIEVEVPVDAVVLSTGVVPHDISELIDMYKCAVGYDSFLLEVHPKLRPVELAVSGVFLAGSCQGPMDITECTSAAAAAASKAAALIAQSQIEMDPFIAHVNEKICTGCQSCLTVCPYEAIHRDPLTKVAVVNEALCTGCGTCVATCPSGAIEQFGFSNRQIYSEVEMILAREQAPAG